MRGEQGAGSREQGAGRDQHKEGLQGAPACAQSKQAGREASGRARACMLALQPQSTTPLDACLTPPPCCPPSSPLTPRGRWPSLDHWLAARLNPPCCTCHRASLHSSHSHTHSSGSLALPRGNHLRVGKPRTPNFSPAGQGRQAGRQEGRQADA